jgi:hypothetical protein
MDNTIMGLKMAEVMNLDLDLVTRALRAQGAE